MSPVLLIGEMLKQQRDQKYMAKQRSMIVLYKLRGAPRAFVIEMDVTCN